MTRFLVILLAACWHTVALGQPSAAEKPAGPVIHLSVSGDIECSQDIRAICAVLDEARATRASLVVIAFSGNNSRLDLVWELGKSIRESSIPVGVFLADPEDKQVGPGQLCLGLYATFSAIAPGTTIRGLANSPNLAPLAPDQTSWAAIGAELSEWIQHPRSGRQFPEDLSGAIVAPTGPLWAVFSADAPHLSTQKPGEDTATVITDVHGTFQFALASKTAARLGLADETPGWSALVAKAGVKTLARTERSVTLGLAQPTRRIKPLMDRIDADTDEIKITLKLPWPASKKTSPDSYHAAAAKAKPKLDDAGAALAELEKLLTDYPELMRRPAPDQTEVGNKASGYASRWRSLVQTRKDRVAKLAGTAEKFAQVKD